MKKAWTVIELASAVKGAVLKDNGRKITGFAIDNRKVVLNNIFVAIKGENHDGHSFVLSAIEAGATAVLVSKDLKELENTEVSVIKVEDTLLALQMAAKYYRKALSNTRFLAITGSNGKTTTRAMVHHILSQRFKCSSTSGNLNNHIGMPLTILDVEADSQYAIIEMGMNHRGEIAQLCEICEPNGALINNIGPAHIGILGSMENIALAKAEVLASLKEGQAGIFPKDTKHTKIFKEAGKNSQLISFGEDLDSDFRLSDIKATDARVDFVFESKKTGDKHRCTLNVQGRHNAYNGAAALALCCTLEPKHFEEFVESMASYKPVEARMELIVKGKTSIILDCYNANPASMEAALIYLDENTGGRKVAVIGDMRELGDLSEFYHRKLGRQVAESNIDLVLCLGDDVDYTVEEAVARGAAPDRIIKLNSEEETADLLKEELQQETVVLFKASRGLHLEKVVQRVWPDIEKSL